MEIVLVTANTSLQAVVRQAAAALQLRLHVFSDGLSIRDGEVGGANLVVLGPDVLLADCALLCRMFRQQATSCAVLLTVTPQTPFEEVEAFLKAGVDDIIETISDWQSLAIRLKIAQKYLRVHQSRQRLSARLRKYRRRLTDFAEHKQIEDALKKSRDMLARAQQIAHLGSWEWNLLTDQIIWSDEMFRIVGISQEDAPKVVTYQNMRRWIHPDDLGQAWDVLQRAIERASSTTLQFRIIRADGQERMVSAECDIIFSNSKAPICVVGTFLDITEKQQAEQRLLQNQLFTQRITEATPDIIYIHDMIDGNIVYMNHPLTEVLGYTDAEPATQEFSDAWIHPNDLKALKKLRKKRGALRDGEILEAEYRLKSKAGEWRWFHGRDTVFLRESTGRIKQIIGTMQDITARKTIEQALQENLNFIKTLINTIPNPIFFKDAQGIYKDCNAAFENMIGLAKTTIIGKSVNDLFGPELGRSSRIEDERLLHQAQLCVDDFSFTKPGELTRNFISYKAPLTNVHGDMVGIVGILFDISERKKVEERMKTIEQRYELAVMAGQVCVWDYQVATDVLYVDPIFADLLGYPPQEIPHNWKAWLAFVEPVDRPRLERILDESRQGRAMDFEIEYRMIHFSGQTRWMIARSQTHAADEGRSRRLVGTLVDITRLKQIEVELNRAKETAESASRAKSEFLANISHELRTPLNAILGYTQILRRDPLISSGHLDRINIIQRSGEHLLMMINDILDLTKIEAGRVQLCPSDFILHDFLNDLLEIVRVRARPKNIPIIGHFSSALPLYVHTDEKLLRQILLNLLNNAIKFTERGQIVLSAKMQGKKTRLEVRDTGIGIAPDQMAKIFLPFHQAHKSDFQTEGTGLGLAISQRLARMLDSEIQLKSTPQLGSIFWLDIDIKEATIKPQDRPAIIHQILGYHGPRRLLLIVDDSTLSREILKDILLPLGFEVTEADSGLTALECTQQTVPDLILMDVMMPGLNGVETTRRLRELPGLFRPVIIALSANAFESTRLECLAAGCNDFIAKPLDMNILLDKLRSYLNLEWIHTPMDAGPAVEAPIHLPPQADLLLLYKIVRSGNVRKVRETIEDMQQRYPSCSGFIVKLDELINRFQINQLRQYIHQFLESGT